MVDILQFKDQYYIYVGGANRTLENLTFVMDTPIDYKPLRREVYETGKYELDAKTHVDGLSIFLAKKLKCPVLFSFNVDFSNPLQCESFVSKVRTALRTEFAI